MKKKHSILSLIMAMSLILTLFVNVAADTTSYENIISLAEPDNSGRTGIDYSIPDIIIIGQVNGTDDGSYCINLTEETLTLPSWYITAAYSTDGGKKWTSLGSKVFDSTAMAKLFSKDITLVITDKYNSKGKKPADDATVVSFGKIKERPKLPSYVINYSIGADDSGMTTGTWLLTLKNGTKSVKEGIEVAVANSAGKAPDEYGYGSFYGKDDTSNGIAIKEFPIGGKAVKTSYYIRTGATYNSDGTYTAASNSKKVTVEGQSKPSTYKVDKKKKTIQYSADTYIFKDDGEMLKPELKKAKGTLDVSNYNGDVYLWSAADDKDPASAMQKTSVTDDGGKELSYTTETVTTLPNHLAPIQYTPFMEVEPYAEPVIIPVEEATTTATEPIASTEETTATSTEPVMTSAEETTSSTESNTESITEPATESETEPAISTEAKTEPVTESTITHVEETTASAIEHTTKPSKAAEPEPTTEPATQPAIQEETTIAPAPNKMEISLPTSTIEIAPANGIIAASDETTTEPPTSPPAILVEYVLLNESSLSMKKGDTITLVATVTPSNATDNTVTWTSSNTSVATVDSNGLVKAAGGGTTTITAIAGGVSSSPCKVTVTVPVESVELNETTLFLKKGDTSTLTAKVNPSDATNTNVTWTSSNKGVATVVNGEVTALKVGKETITVTTEDGSKTAVCEVEVYDITIPQGDFQMGIGSSVPLTATVTDSGGKIYEAHAGVKWAIDNDAVAKVAISNGVWTVSGEKDGTANITASYIIPNSGTLEVTITATCMVTVGNRVVTGVTLPKDGIILTLNDPNSGHTQLVPTILPNEASNKKVTWASDNLSVATVDEHGVVTAKSIGTATITVITLDGGFNATCKITVVAPKYKINFYVNGGNGSLEAEVSGSKLVSVAEVNEGSSVIFTAKPNIGYRVKEWTLSGIEIGDWDFDPAGIDPSDEGKRKIWTLKSLKKDITVNVIFEPIPPKIIVPDLNGEVNKSYNKKFNAESAVAVTWSIKSLGANGETPPEGFKDLPTHFMINPTTGEFTTTRTLVKGDGGKFIFYIVAKDTNGNQTETKCTFSITDWYDIHFRIDNSLGGYNGQLEIDASNKTEKIKYDIDKGGIQKMDNVVEGATVIFTATPLNQDYKAEWEVYVMEIDQHGNPIPIADTDDPEKYMKGSFNPSETVYTVYPLDKSLYVVLRFRPANYIEVAFDTANPEGGSVSVLASGIEYIVSPIGAVREGSRVEFTAMPNYDWRVKEWRRYNVKNPTSSDTPIRQVGGDTFIVDSLVSNSGYVIVEVEFEEIPSVSVSAVTIPNTTPSIGINGTATPKLKANVSPSVVSDTPVTWDFDKGGVKDKDGNSIDEKYIEIDYEASSAILKIDEEFFNPPAEPPTEPPTEPTTEPTTETEVAYVPIRSFAEPKKYIKIAAINQFNGEISIFDIEEVKFVNMKFTVTATAGGKTGTSLITIAKYQAVTGVTVNKNSTSIVVGAKEQLTMSVSPIAASNKDVTWSSSNPAVATVDQNGLVTGVSVGEVKIIVTTKDGTRVNGNVIPFTAECAVTITAPTLNLTPADNKDFGRVTEGYTKQVAHSVIISNVGTSISAALTVSLDGDAEGFVLSKTSMGSIRAGSSATFTVTPADGLEPGLYTATVVISGENTGDLTFDVKFEVLAPVPPMITTNLLSNGIEKEPYTEILDAVGSPSSTWEVSSGKLPNGLSLNKNSGVISGTPTSKGSTEFEITAKNTEGSDTKMFSIEIEGIVAVTGVTLSEEKVSILIGDVITLAANVNPINATNTDVIWSSSNPTVATVNSNGAVTGIAAGTAKITVMTVDGSKTDTCDITVMATPVTGMTLNKNVTGLVVGKSETLVAMIEPPNAANKSVAWSSSNPAIATVNSNGVVTGVAVGTATITARTVDGNYTDTCTVMVSAVSIPVTGVTLSAKSASVVAGSTMNLSATISPSNATNQKIIWSSSNNAIATIDANGKVTGVSAGTTTITVKTDDGGKSDSCTVTVMLPKVAVTSVSLNTTSTTIPVGGTAVLTPFISPSDATNQNVTWVSGNSNIVSVDANGKISGLAVGTATITVRTSDGGKTATCSVTVSSTNVAVTNVAINPASTTIGVGATTDLTPIITPSNATNQNVMWSSSNNTVATVDATGEVKGIAAGTAVITVRTSDGSKTATCSVTVSAIPVSGVTLNKSSMSIGIGVSETLTATVSPSNAANRGVTWSSSDTTIATVDSNGKVTGKSAGTASVTVKTADGNKTATCSVTVSFISVTGVMLKSATTIAVGDTETLTPTISPSGATDKNVTWSSSDASIVTVDTNGTITGVSIGTATIEVTTADGAKTAICNVTVAVAYNITLTQSKGGIATISHTKAVAGAKVTMSPSADNGYYLVGWKISPVDIAVSGNSFTMPASNITVVPIYHRIPLISEYISPVDIDTRNPSYTFRFREYEIADGSIGMSIPGSTLEDLTRRNSKFIIEFETPYGMYRLPTNIASIIPDLNDILSDNNLKISDISFNIILTDKTKDKAFIDSLSRDMPNSKMIGSAVDFTIEIVRYADGKLGNMIAKAGDFTQQVERLIPMPAEITEMPKYWGAYRYNETSKRFEFVPHTTRTIDGKLYVIIQSATNSIYTVAENPVTFADVPSTEWYVEYVSKAAAKRLVQGVGSGLYEPERDVTRAEFVQMMVTALQLPKAKSDTKAYDDVTGDWYYDAIMRAKSAGLLNKFAGNSFNPEQSITREEIAVILAAVIRYRNFTVAGTPATLLGVFGDYGNFNDSYAEDIELVYRAKIMQGIGGGLFDPKGTTTRAQAATVQVRVLEMLKFID